VFRALATRHGLYDLDLFAATGVLDKRADVDDAIVAGVVARVLGAGCCVQGIAGWQCPLDVHSCLLK
jgi:hypothetical protein